MSLIGWLIDHFVEKPAQRVLVGLFLAALYGNWQRSQDLSRVCDLVSIHDWSVAHPRIAKQEIDDICAGRQPADD